MRITNNNFPNKLPSKLALNIDNKFLYYGFFTILMLVTVYCLSSAFTRGVASAWYFNAEFALDNVSENKTENAEEEYPHILAAIKKAQSLDPTHPHYAHMLGRVMHWGVGLGLEEKSTLSDVKAWYLLATALRPLWQDPWADLVRLNNDLYGYNDETKHYIAQALATGPYNNLVTVTTLQVWLSHWSELSGTELASLFKQFDVATKQPKTLEQVLKFAKSINRAGLLCSQLKYNRDYVHHKSTSLYKRMCLH